MTFFFPGFFVLDLFLCTVNIIPANGRNMSVV